MSSDLSVVAVTCLALEARIAAGANVSVICSHASQLVVALETTIRQGAGGIISFGIAGGLAPDLVAGDWVIAAGVQTDRGRLSTDRGWARRLLAALPGAVHADIVGVDARWRIPMKSAGCICAPVPPPSTWSRILRRGSQPRTGFRSPPAGW
jgi:adenosylhomocysteine nucleosidase